MKYNKNKKIQEQGLHDTYLKIVCSVFKSSFCIIKMKNIFFYILALVDLERML